MSGNGQALLADVLCGVRAPTRGRVALAGAVVAATPQAWVAAGVARIPEDRHAIGVIGDLPVWENAMSERYRTRFARTGWVRRGAARTFAQQVIERFDVRAGRGLDTPARALSGGNMQKLILGRVLLRDAPPVLIVANQPTWGLDIGAVAFVHQQLLDACAQGAAVLLVSDDLDEIFALADRVAVMHAGHLGEARPAGAWTRQAIGLAMAGASGHEASHAA